MEGVDIKKLFDYELFMGKCLHPINWAALFATTVDTRQKISFDTSLVIRVMEEHLERERWLHNIIQSTGANLPARSLLA